MCNFTVLAQSENGYVVYCLDCAMFQFAFGTTLLKVPLHYFERITNEVHELSVNTTQVVHPNVKNITVPLEEGILMCLTFTELMKLEVLLNEAVAIFETHRILQNI